MYLTAQYVMKPTGIMSTSAKGFWSNPHNYHFEERVQITRHLRDSDLKGANVILDLARKEVMKCRARKEDPISAKQTYDEIYDYFYTHYKEYLDKVQTSFDIDLSNITTIG